MSTDVSRELTDAEWDALAEITPEVIERAKRALAEDSPKLADLAEARAQAGE